MKEIPLTLPEFGMINITRFIIGAGTGLLLSGKLDNKARRAVGVTLLSVGTLFSIPVGIVFFGKLRGSRPLQVSDRSAA